MEDRYKKLIDLYSSLSKHSHYQTLPTVLSKVLNPYSLEIGTKYEFERLNFVLKKVDLNGKNILDIGGNTGFFSIEPFRHGVTRADYFDGNTTHADFVSLVSKMFLLDINVSNEYFLFKNKFGSKFDLSFLLNVLHHVGDDYSTKVFTRDLVLDYIQRALRYMALTTKFLILQIGFNWKGDIKLPLFESGTKKEMISFIQNAVDGYWKILAIGVPVKKKSNVIYEDMNSSNIERCDALGEFLNRPLFILYSTMN